MDRTERFYKIELLLRDRGCVSFAALRDTLEVSPATLKRDLQYLRERLGAPIVYDTHDNGYRFEAPPAASASTSASGPASARAAPRHELPGLWFSENEVHALLTMHQLLAGLDESGVLARHLQPMLERLEGMLGADARQASELARRVKVIGTARRRVSSRWFELLGSALVRRQRVHISYFKRSDRSTGVRELSPQRLVHYRNTWYLDAWCHVSDALRRFSLDAVRAATLLDTKARPVSLRDLEAALDAGYGIYGSSGAKLRWATLVFEADAAQWVENEEWHPRQKSRTRADGRYELQVPYGEPVELVMDILRHGDTVVVEGDAPLAAAVKARLDAARSRYA